MKIMRILCILLMLTMLLVSCGKNEVASGDTDDLTSVQTETETESGEPGSDDPAESSGDTTAMSADPTPSQTTETAAGTDPEPTETTETDVPETTPADTTATTEVSTTEPQPTEPPYTEPVVVDPQPATYVPSTMMYHLIRDDVYGVYEALFVRPSLFESQLITLNERGYEYLFAEDWHLTEKPSVVITLDDGYVDNYTNMFPLLKKYGAKATVFIVSDFIDTDGYLTREMIAEMSASGLVSFQCHTASHVDLRNQSEAGLHDQFKRSVAIIEGITGKPVKALAYPAGGYNSTVLAVAGEYFDFAYTTKSPYSTPNYTALTIPRNYVARDCTAYQFSAFLK